MTEITINWKQGDTISDWDEKCIRVIETFGLPGGKYTTKLSEDHMILNFVDAEDALMARLLIGG
jgi:hypothetical protein